MQRLWSSTKSENVHWRQLLATSRPLAWLKTAGPFLAGGWLAYGHPTPQLLIGFTYFLFPYNLALYGASDAYDFTADAHHSRKAGAESILPTAKRHQLWFWIAVVNLPFLVYLFLSGTLGSRLWLLFSLGMVALYGLQGIRLNEIPFIDSIVSSIHFWSPLVYGTLLGGGSVTYRPALAAFILWAMATQSFGAIQDLAYDRAAGVASIATALRERGTVYFGAICYALAAGLVILGFGLPGLVVGIALLGYVINVLVAGFSAGPPSLRYRRGWQVLQRLNLLVGLIIIIGLLVILNPFGHELLLH